MPTITVQEVTTFQIETCISCGVRFGLTDDYAKERQRDHKNFSCPNGHLQHWPQKTPHELEIERLKADLERESQARIRQAERATRLENDLMDQAKEMKRQRRRHHAGTCPHCNRSFANMARHIAKQHPAEHAAVLQTSRTNAAKSVQPAKAK